MKNRTRSYFSIVAVGFQLFNAIAPFVYFSVKGEKGMYNFTGIWIELILNAVFFYFLIRGYKWAYILYFALQITILGLIFLRSGFGIHPNNFLLVVLSGFGLFVKIAKEKEIAEQIRA